mmetsp:Transcript_42985/g.64814  ORF Transcript_42985/g.64814 Transcript_42985/m.64814 type:complete len:425 (+) Transcript_42985:685-1959(+)
MILQMVAAVLLMIVSIIVSQLVAKMELYESSPIKLPLILLNLVDVATFVVDGPIVSLHLSMSPPPPSSLNTFMNHHYRQHVHRQDIYLVVGSLCGFACFFRQIVQNTNNSNNICSTTTPTAFAMEQEEQEQYNATTNENTFFPFHHDWDGPYVIVDGLWNGKLDVEDGVLSVCKFPFGGTISGTAIAVGTHSGRVLLFEPVIDEVSRVKKEEEEERKEGEEKEDVSINKGDDDVGVSGGVGKYEKKENDDKDNVKTKIIDEGEDEIVVSQNTLEESNDERNNCDDNNEDGSEENKEEKIAKDKDENNTDDISDKHEDGRDTIETVNSIAATPPPYHEPQPCANISTSPPPLPPSPPRYKLFWRCKLPYPIHGLALEDVDGDGLTELLISTRRSVHVFRADAAIVADITKQRILDILKRSKRRNK